MIIGDLHHLETVAQSNDIIGGLGDIDIDINLGNVTNQINFNITNQTSFSAALAGISAEAMSKNLALAGQNNLSEL